MEPGGPDVFLRAALTVAVAAGLAYVVMRLVVPCLLPFLVALFVAVLIDPWVARLERALGGRRGLAVLGVLGALSVVLGGLVAVGVGRIYAEVHQFARNLPELDRGLGAVTEEWLARIQSLYSGLPQPVVEAIRANRFRIYQELQALAGRLTDFVVSLPRLGVAAVVTWIATFFMSRDKERLAAWLEGVLPRTAGARLRRVKAEVAAGLLGLLRAQVMLAAITTAASVVALGAFGVPYAWLLGLLAGILDVVPFVGPWIVLVPVVGWLALSGRVAGAVGLAVVSVGILAVRQAVEPRIVGASLGVHPLFALVAAYAGVKILGPAGIVAGPCALVLARAMARGGLMGNETGGHPGIDRLHREAGGRRRGGAAGQAQRHGAGSGR